MAITSGPRSTSPSPAFPVELARVPLAKIDLRPGQPRENAAGSAIDELAPSVRQYDIVQPVILRRVENGRYELVAGERRYHAALAAGKETIPATIRYLTDDQAAELSLVENVCRRDLNPIEKARAIKALATAAKGRTVADVARLCGKSDVWAHNLTRLLKLPPDWQALIGAEEVPQSAGRLLLPYLDGADGQAILDAVLLDRQQRPEQYVTRAAFERSAAAVADRVRSPGERGSVSSLMPAECDHVTDTVTAAVAPPLSPDSPEDPTADHADHAEDPAADARTAVAAELPANLAEAFAADHAPAATPRHKHPLTTDVLAARICRLIGQLDDLGQCDQVRQALDAKQSELQPKITRPRRKRAG